MRGCATIITDCRLLRHLRASCPSSSIIEVANNNFRFSSSALTGETPVRLDYHPAIVVIQRSMVLLPAIQRATCGGPKDREK